MIIIIIIFLQTSKISDLSSPDSNSIFWSNSFLNISTLVKYCHLATWKFQKIKKTKTKNKQKIIESEKWCKEKIKCKKYIYIHLLQASSECGKYYDAS